MGALHSSLFAWMHLHITHLQMKIAFVPIFLALFTQAQGKIAALKPSSKTASKQNDFLAFYDQLHEIQDGHHGRELIFDEECSNILSGFIGGILPFPGADITCDCALNIAPPAVSASCGSTLPVCFVPPDIICGEPSLSFSLDILSIFTGLFPFSAEICYNNLMIGGILDLSFIPFCLSLPPEVLGFLGAPAGDAQAGNYTIDSVDNPCTAKIGDQECISCDVCSSSTISFNCTNIHKNFVATCTDIGVIPTSFPDIARVNEVTLGVDSLP